MGIRTRINELINKYFDRNDLDSNGAIYYANGNDGTRFDSEMNDRTCEFMVWGVNGYGAIKSFVTRDNRLESYVYDLNDPFNSDRVIVESVTLEGYDFDLLVDQLETLFDDNDRFDEIVTDREWSIID